MTPLPLQFHRSTFIYRQVCRFGDVALYIKKPAFTEGAWHLEVIRVLIGAPREAEFTLRTGGKYYGPPSELYPLPGDYGKHLFSVKDEAEAFGLMAALLIGTL